MKNIIVPTDFSASAKNAFVYAKELSERLHGKLKVIHYWHPDADMGSGGPSYLSMDELMKAREDRIANFVQSGEESEKEKGSLPETEIVAGFVSSALEEASKSEHVDLILMGTNGESGMAKKIFGSVSSHVSQHAHCPVWLIPPNAKYKGIKNVMYASDYEHADDKVIQQVVHLAHKFKANIHLVHVSKDGKTKTTEEMKYIFEELDTSVKFSLSNIQNDNVWEGLDNFASKHEMDLMVLVTRHRSFWERVRHKSQSKSMISHIKVPIILMHLDDKNEVW